MIPCEYVRVNAMRVCTDLVPCEYGCILDHASMTNLFMRVCLVQIPCEYCLKCVLCEYCTLIIHASMSKFCDYASMSI